MYTQEATTLAEAYFDLATNYTLENICTFLQACWLLPEGRSFTENSLERMIYTEGDQYEVFTRPERNYIKSVKHKVYSCKIPLATKSGNADGRIVAFKLDSGSNTIFDSIVLMKIFNKAIDGLNLFLFVTPSGVHFGCSSLTRSDTTYDCLISPLVCPVINWELLCDNFIFRNDSAYLYEYYSGIVSVFEGIKYCFSDPEEQTADWYASDYDDEYHEDRRRFRLEDYLDRHSYVESKEPVFDIDRFDKEVYGCMQDLSYIVKAHVNPLEMLFKAEEALAIVEKQASDNKYYLPSTLDDADMCEIELLDDPIALMKKLKKDRGM